MSAGVATPPGNKPGLTNHIEITFDCVQLILRKIYVVSMSVCVFKKKREGGEREREEREDKVQKNN